MRPSPAAVELADAMRAGLVMRRSLGAVEVVQGLRTRARVHDYPPVAAPGPLRRPMLLLRRIAHVLVRPWWALQSDLNDSILAALEELNRELAAQHEALAVLRTRAARGGDGPSRVPAGPSGIGPELPAANAARRPAPAVSRQTLEQVFAHSHLRAAPARVLVVADEARDLVDLLSAFGFDATCLAPSQLATPPGQGRPAAPPLLDGSFDHVVDLGGACGDGPAQAVRLLKPDGTLIGSISLPPDPSAGVDPAGAIRPKISALLAPLRCTELVLAVEDEGSWRVLTGSEGPAGVAAHLPDAAIALFVAERA